MNKFLCSFLLASTLMIPYGNAMEVPDDVQGFLVKMPSALSILYHTPKEERKAAVLVLPVESKEEIGNAIFNISEENNPDIHSIVQQIEYLRTQKTDALSSLEEYSEKIKNATNLKNQAEQDTRDFLNQAEAHACQIASSQASEQQLNQIKENFVQYIKKTYKLISNRTVLQSIQARETSQNQAGALYDSFFESTCNTLKVDKVSLISNPAFRKIEEFPSKYFFLKGNEEIQISKIKFFNESMKKFKIEEIENKIKEIETPLNLFLYDLYSILTLL